MRTVACALALALLAPACGGGEREAVTVVATIVPVAMIARELGGEGIRVRALVPPGASPHTFEPRPGDLAALAGARLFVQVGAGLDDWAARLVAAGGPELRRLVLIGVTGLDPLPADPAHDHDHSEEVDPDADLGAHADPHGAPLRAQGGPSPGGRDGAAGRASHGRFDPHVWLDPIRVRDALAPALAESLSALDPAEALAVDARLADFQARLTALDEEIRRTLADVPLRSFLPFHNAWRYFASRYELRELAVVQESPGEEPTPRELARLVEAARRASIAAILVEPQLDARVAAALAAEFRGATVLVDPIGDPSDPERESYEALMRFNARAFRRALSAEAP